MTGHGRGSAQAEGWLITAECASVNRKGIEIAISLPKPLSTLEPKLRELIQKRIGRGRINVSVSLENAAGPDNSQGVVDWQAARRILQELQVLQTELNLPGQISLELLLQSPGVFRNGMEQTPDHDALLPALQIALNQALDRMIMMRKKEGAHLVADLLKRIKLLERQMLDHAKNLEFEKAARVRDQLALLREQMFGAAGHDSNVVPLVAQASR